ncbi:MAG: DJ-1/PfpI family protein [bacterium]
MSYAIGILLAVLTIVLGVSARFERRTFVAIMACVNATYYVLFAVIDGASRAILVETALSLGFMALALVGFRRDLRVLAAVLAGHGVLDLVHPHLVANTGVPVWWPSFCLTFDVTAALLVLLLVHRAKNSEVPAAGTELTDFMIPHAMLTESGVARVVSVAPHAGRIRLRPGTVSIEPDLTMAAFDAANPKGADYVIVPALLDHENLAIAAWIRAQAACGATIMSICEGARTAAKAGVLAGRRATTHWSALEELSKKYPGIT